VDIDRAWETIREEVKMSAKESLDYYEFKMHKPWFEEISLIYISLYLYTVF
jgi:hypothetical protein